MREILLSISLCLIIGQLTAQEEYPYPSLSPKGHISQVVGNTLLKIEYERPSARKRKIFGELVPWNKVWRTGAGYCTKISFDKAVKVGGQAISKGRYSLFSIPNPDSWIIILNKDTTLYGSFAYKATEDVARFVVIPQNTDRYYETLNIDIELIPNNARIYISWENTQIYFDIETSTDEQIAQLISEELLSGKEKNSDIYAGAAEYHLYQGTNLVQALQLADKALAIDENNGWARILKVRIYERLHHYKMALAELELAIAQAKKAKYENEKARAAEIQSLEKRYQSIQKKQKG